jgi:CRISPR-associated exonuclease Cas4
LIALSTLAIGLLLVLAGRGMRRLRGLGEGRTLDLDGRNLYSARYGLAGRPDRIVEEGGLPIPEEWKSTRRVYDSHRAQMGTYFILIEEETGIRPPYGFVVTGAGRRHRIENTDELRARVLQAADRIRAARRQVDVIIQVNPPPGQCRSCGMRKHCGQRRG